MKKKIFETTDFSVLQEAAVGSRLRRRFFSFRKRRREKDEENESVKRPFLLIPQLYDAFSAAEMFIARALYEGG